MPASSPTDGVTLTRLARPRPIAEALADDVRRGLVEPPRSLPPIYFYDARGSELFERITELEEYYPTRTETAILDAHARELVRRIRPHELLELGSGSSTKTGLLLEAMREVGGERYAALEISEAALVEASRRLASEHPWLRIDGYVGDFHDHLPAIEREGTRLLTFLGSTLGNLKPQGRQVLLRDVADAMGPDDAFLVGIDLVKGADVLLPAYDDARGVTAEFNRNVLHVINRELEGDLPVDAFAHRAVWDEVEECVEMRLVASRDVRAHLRAMDLPLRFAAGDVITTEHSCKFRLDAFGAQLAEVGLHVEEVRTDTDEHFALVLAVPDGSERSGGVNLEWALDLGRNG